MTSSIAENEATTTLSYSDIEASVDNLKDRLQESRTRTEILSIQELRDFANKGIALREDFRKFMRTVSREKIDEEYPNRGQVVQSIRSVVFDSLGAISFDELSEEEKGEYISALVEMNGEFYDKHQNGYYYIGWPKFVAEIPEEYRNLKKISEDYYATLTQEQEDDIYRYEESTYKIHLSVPPERKIEVMKHLLSVLNGDNEIVKEIFDEKKENNQTVSASTQEVRERGGKLAGLISWKMKDFSHDDFKVNADFVFYPRSGKGETPEDALITLVNDLSMALSELDLPEIESLPRFSTQIVKDGINVPGMSFVQGNGDFKSYLLRTGGEEKLSKYYDPQNNFAVRTGTTIDF